MRVAVVAAALAVVGCQAAPSGPTATTTPTTTSTTVPPTTVVRVDPCQAGDQPFVEDGRAGTAGSPDSDATVLGRVSWTVFDTCERVTLAFTTLDGAPAVSPPRAEGTLLRAAGVLRVSLGPTIQASAIADQTLDTGLVDRAYVVGGADGELLVDLHLAAPAFARLSASSSPATVVIDLVPGGPGYLAPRLVTDALVLVDPVAGSVRYPLTINGYTAPGEEEVAAMVLGEDRTVVAEAAVGTVPGTWGGFGLVVPSGPTGPVLLSIGDDTRVTLTAE